MEIEFIGKGGKGSVAAAKLLCDVATKAEYNSQSLAFCGSRRRGGVVESCIRIEKEKVLVHARMSRPPAYGSPVAGGRYSGGFLLPEDNIVKYY